MLMNNLENISRLLKPAKRCVDAQEKASIQNSVKIASSYSTVYSDPAAISYRYMVKE